MSLRVAILCEYPTLNGGERSLLACVDRFPVGGVALTFLAPADGPLANELRQRGLRHVPFDLRVNAARLPRDVILERLAEVCVDCDLLHANSLAMGRLTGAAARRLAIPCAAHLRDIVRLTPAAVGDLSGNQQLIAVSRAVRDFHVARGLAAEQVTVIYNGIDPAAVASPGLCVRRLRSELGLTDPTFIVATIGQICLRKGQDVFAESAERIAAAVPHAHFLLIGSRHSSKTESVDYEAAIAARFAQAGLADRFHALGQRTDVPKLLREIDVLVHAARQEPFGRVLLEAAASGVPIVATAVGGTPEMLTDGVHALLVRPDDPRAIAEAVVRLAAEPELRRRLGLSAREHVIARFPIDRAAGELFDLWRRIAASSR